jgi:hypothetical protein
MNYSKKGDNKEVDNKEAANKEIGLCKENRLISGICSLGVYVIDKRSRRTGIFIQNMTRSISDYSVCICRDF